MVLILSSILSIQIIIPQGRRFKFVCAHKGDNNNNIYSEDPNCRVSFGNMLSYGIRFEFELSKGKQNSLGETLYV